MTRRPALLLFAGLLLLYNSNGREIGTVDSQPTKFTAREVALRGTLRLDAVIAERPGLAERAAFTRTHGHYRSAYPILPALIAAVPATILHWTHIVDMRAPLAPNLIAVLTASILTAASVVLVYLSMLRLVSPSSALLVAIGLGVGTNFWPVVSRTLWQHETVAFGAAMALWSWLRPRDEMRPVNVWLGAIGLAAAGAARPQLAPLIFMMWLWFAWRDRHRDALLTAIILGVAATLIVATNYYWFGSWMGGAMHTEAANPQTHAVSGTVSDNALAGAAGLLISPSRGLLVFSPIVFVTVFGLRQAWSTHRPLGLRWLILAVAAQFAVYSFYSIWWGGHTYGPRYLLDVLIPLTPVAALGVERFARNRIFRIAGTLALGWSIGVAALGAFVYPEERWNTNPDEIDLNHARLWSIRDSQIPRAFHAPFSAQNFDLFARASIRPVQNPQ